MLKRIAVIGCAVSLIAAPAANAHGVPPSRYLETARPYAPYEFLIGDWYSEVPAEKLTLHQQFRWGPQKAYIIYSAFIKVADKPEQLHFEGMMVWNGRAKALDFLFALQPPSGAEEKGTVSVQPDGSVLREVEMTQADGKSGRFRQTFRKDERGSVITSMTQQTDKGWVTSPPGDLAMTRGPETASR